MVLVFPPLGEMGSVFPFLWWWIEVLLVAFLVVTCGERISISFEVERERERFFSLEDTIVQRKAIGTVNRVP